MTQARTGLARTGNCILWVIPVILVAMTSAQSLPPELDTEVPPRTPGAAQAVVDYIVAVGDAAEKHYLEAKSDLDLRGRPGPAVIAKFILAAANRDPKIAAQAFKGFAALVIGAERGSAGGIPPIDDAALGEKMLPYLGSTGPNWETVRLPVEGSDNEVLVVVVDPPEPGQRPFVCRGAGEGIHSGRIYIRRGAQTVHADAGEVDQILDRWTVSRDPSLDVEVQVTGKCRRYFVDASLTLEPYLERERQSLLSQLPEPKPPKAKARPDPFSALSGPDLTSQLRPRMFMEEFGKDRRTRQGYRDQIEEWEERFREGWAAAVRALCAYVLEPNTITVSNRNDAFLEGVEVDLCLSDPVTRVASRDGNKLYVGRIGRLGLPSRPHDWGKDHFGAMNPSSGDRLTEDREDREDRILLELAELRPGRSLQQEHPEVFLVDAEDSAERRVKWTLSARGRHETLDDEVIVPVAPVEDLTAQMRILLDLR